MVSMNVSLPEPTRDWVQRRIEAADYASVSDYVKDLIRRDQIEVEERQALIAALMAGERSGISERRVPDIIAVAKQDLAVGQGG